MPIRSNCRALLRTCCALLVASWTLAASTAQANPVLEILFPNGRVDPELAVAADAFEKGHYDIVLQEAEPLAAQGSSKAQFLVKVSRILVEIATESPPTESDLRERQYEKAKQLYETGQYKSALQSLRTMANEGDREAQLRLYWMVQLLFHDLDSGLIENLGEKLDEQNLRNEAFHHLEQAALHDYDAAQATLAFHYYGTFADSGDPALLEKAIDWSFLAVRSLEAPRIIYYGYCYAPEYKQDERLAAAWFTIANPDYAFYRSPEYLDENWDEVKTHWARQWCFHPDRLTKEFIRDAHRRAIALSEVYDIEVSCVGLPRCTNPPARN